MDTGVDLSFIVKAVPAVASEEKPEEQTHEIIQVSVVPQAEVCFLQNYPNFTLNMSFFFFFLLAGFGIPPNWKRLHQCYRSDGRHETLH